VDSAIGGKVAIDTEFAKNLVGAFYQPKAVISDTGALKTLPKRQVRNGLAEIIKYGIILDKRLFAYVEKNITRVLRLDTGCMESIISRCSRLKAEVVAADECEESGYRSILNFGHTAGHAIEVASSYRRSMSHGEAIAVGMLIAFDIAVSLGMATRKTASRVEALIHKAGLPTSVKKISAEKIIKATSYDKKIVRGRRRWVLPAEIGHVVVCHSLPPGIVKQAICKRLL